MSASIRLIESIDRIDPAQWDSLAGTDNPFLKHAFLAALEHSGCASAASGWKPQHLVLQDAAGTLVAAMPLYLKDHSWGEFVFDWAWADAYHRAGLEYYPKLVSAIPFTPATGTRLLISEDTDRPAAQAALVEALLDLAKDLEVSSCHVLFPPEEQLEALRANGFLIRKDCQFHWCSNGERDFEDFLTAFSSRKRKKVRRERRRIAEFGIEFETYRGGDMSRELWNEVYRLHASTFALRGRRPYLNRQFFTEIDATLPASLMVKVARDNSRVVAAAIFFQGGETLYGRYWGCREDIHSLHFEACYYQGIDYCLAHGLKRFEPGTQGEHKISRGFVPVPTWSAHWLAHHQFSRAVADFLAREQDHVDSYMSAVNEHLPFRSDRQIPTL